MSINSMEMFVGEEKDKPKNLSQDKLKQTEVHDINLFEDGVKEEVEQVSNDEFVEVKPKRVVRKTTQIVKTPDELEGERLAKLELEEAQKALDTKKALEKEALRRAKEKQEALRQLAQQSLSSDTGKELETQLQDVPTVIDFNSRRTVPISEVVSENKNTKPKRRVVVKNKSTEDDPKLTKDEVVSKKVETRSEKEDLDDLITKSQINNSQKEESISVYSKTLVVDKKTGINSLKQDFKSLYSEIEYDRTFKKLTKMYSKGYIVLADNFECFYYKKMVMIVGYRGDEPRNTFPTTIGSKYVGYICPDVYKDFSIRKKKVKKSSRFEDFETDSFKEFSTSDTDTVLDDLDEIVLPEYLVTIPNKFFRKVTTATKVVIPANVKEIAVNAFKDSTIEEVYFNGKPPIGIDLINFGENCRVYVNLKYANKYNQIFND